MGFLDSIEKLINEHGSATILKERIQLANDKYSALEDKVSILQQENGILKEQNTNLKSQLDEAKKKIDSLNQTIEQLNKNNKRDNLDDVTVDILKMFFNAGRELSVRDFRNMPINVIQYHFDILMQHNFIIPSSAGIVSSWSGEDSPGMYDITPAGRKYVIENKII